MEQAVAETATLDEQGLQENSPRARLARGILWMLLIAAVLIAPLFLYPVFVMQLLCFALFACAFNLLIGFCPSATRPSSGARPTSPAT
jgi:branched-chain amino acid transport system permease protein